MSAPSSLRARSFGEYQLLELIGSGGMGEIWRAARTRTDGALQSVVLKMILPHLATNPEVVAMFEHETRLAARLQHPNIVRLLDVGDVHGERYMAMAYVHGVDLQRLLRERTRRGAPDPGFAAYAVAALCRALAYAHALTDDDGRPLGLVHRDVSPANVMVGYDGRICLLDFGIAKALSLVTDSRTKTGFLKGKLRYLAPEQIANRPNDHRADQFACGVVLHELITGTPLFKGSSDLQLMYQILEQEIAAPSLLNDATPPALDRVCLRALSHTPQERFHDCNEMAKALEQVAADLGWGAGQTARLMAELFPGGDLTETTLDIPPPPFDLPMNTAAARPLALRRRRSTRVIAAISGAALAIAGAGLLFARRGHSPSRQHAAGPTAPASALTPAFRLDAPATGTTTSGLASATAASIASVSVAVDSDPPGADVTLAGETGSRGVTPLEMLVPFSKSERSLVVTRAGHAPESIHFTPDRDSRIRLTLRPDPAARALPTASKHRHSPVASATARPEPPGPATTPPQRPSTDAAPVEHPSIDFQNGAVVDPFAH